MFRATMNKGVQFTFEKVVVSIQWGTSNFCEKRDLSAEFGTELKSYVWESSDAEVAVWNNVNNVKNHTYRRDYPHASEHDNVVSHLNLSQVMDILRWAESQ